VAKDYANDEIPKTKLLNWFLVAWMRVLEELCWGMGEG